MIAMTDIFLVVGFGLEIIKSELTLFLMSCCGTTVYLTHRFCILYKDEELYLIRFASTLNSSNHTSFFA